MVAMLTRPTLVLNRNWQPVGFASVARSLTLVWVENRFSHILSAGQYAYRTGQKQVRVEIIDIRPVRFEHDQFKVVVRSPLANRVLDVCTVHRVHVGVLFIDGRYVDTLAPGEYAF